MCFGAGSRGLPLRSFCASAPSAFKPSIPGRHFVDMVDDQKIDGSPLRIAALTQTQAGPGSRSAGSGRRSECRQPEFDQEVLPVPLASLGCANTPM